MKNKFDPVIRSSWVVIGLCVCSFVAILLLSMNSENNRWLESFWWLIIAVPVFIFDALFLLVIYSARDKYEKGLAAQQAGDYFVKWTFTQLEWERFLKDDWRRTKKRAIIASGIVIVLFMIIVHAAGAVKSDLHFWYALFGVIGFMGIVIYFVLHFCYVVYQERLAGPREVVIGKTGVSISGVYTAWDTTGAKLSDVKMIKGHYAILQFVIGTQGRVGSPTYLYVPVPEGREYEAEEVLRKLS